MYMLLGLDEMNIRVEPAQTQPHWSTRNQTCLLSVSEAPQVVASCTRTKGVRLILVGRFCPPAASGEAGVGPRTQFIAFGNPVSRFEAKRHIDTGLASGERPAPWRSAPPRCSDRTGAWPYPPRRQRGSLTSCRLAQSGKLKNPAGLFPPRNVVAHSRQALSLGDCGLPYYNAVWCPAMPGESLA
jgi:hypothetical protein